MNFLTIPFTALIEWWTFRTRRVMKFITVLNYLLMHWVFVHFIWDLCLFFRRFRFVHVFSLTLLFFRTDLMSLIYLFLYKIFLPCFCLINFWFKLRIIRDQLLIQWLDLFLLILNIKFMNERIRFANNW
jgi:hypothetical protein